VSAPAVSIILPSFNRLPFLRAAIESVQGQTFTDWELIVADDGSDASTRAWLAAARLQRQKTLLLEHCGNPARVRNAALAAATGRYIAFLDSDDRWLPDKLALQFEYLRRHPAIRWCYSAIRRIDAQGGTLAGDERREWIPFDGAILEPLLQQRVGLALPTVMVERSLIEEVGGFDENLAVHEDFDLWLRLAGLSPVGVLVQSLTEVRCHDQHYSDAGARSIGAWDVVLAKHEPRCTDSATRQLVRRARAGNAARLARHNARIGDAGGVFRVLRQTFGVGWSQLRWWHGAALAFLRLLLPGSWTRRGWARP
jgi:glycosyltransferase involved in cell wall biosynthesis